MQSCHPGLQGWWLLPPALCLLLLQPIDLGLSHSSFHHLFRSPPPHLPLLRSWPLSWPAAAAGLRRDPASPRQSHPLEGRSVLPLPQNLQLYLGTGDDPVKKENTDRKKVGFFVVSVICQPFFVMIQNWMSWVFFKLSCSFLLFWCHNLTDIIWTKPLNPS